MLESFQRQLRDREKEREKERRKSSRLHSDFDGAINDNSLRREEGNSIVMSGEGKGREGRSSSGRSLSVDAVHRAAHRHRLFPEVDARTKLESYLPSGTTNDLAARKGAVSLPRPGVISVSQVEELDVPEMQESGRDSPPAVPASSRAYSSSSSRPTATIAARGINRSSDTQDDSADDSDVDVVINVSRVKKNNPLQLAGRARVPNGSASFTTLKVNGRHSNSHLESIKSAVPITDNSTLLEERIVIHTSPEKQTESHPIADHLTGENSRVDLNVDERSIALNGGNSGESELTQSSSVTFSHSLADTMKSNTARAILKEFLGQTEQVVFNQSPVSPVKQKNASEVRQRKRNHIHKALLELNNLEL